MAALRICTARAVVLLATDSKAQSGAGFTLGALLVIAAHGWIA
jgi:hypothetical protein